MGSELCIRDRVCIELIITLFFKVTKPKSIGLNMLGYLSLIGNPLVSEISYRDHVVTAYAALRYGIMDATLGVFLTLKFSVSILQV